jgi:hypothetical protein
MFRSSHSTFNFFETCKLWLCFNANFQHISLQIVKCNSLKSSSKDKQQNFPETASKLLLAFSNEKKSFHGPLRLTSKVTRSDSRVNKSPPARHIKQNLILQVKKKNSESLFIEKKGTDWDTFCWVFDDSMPVSLLLVKVGVVLAGGVAGL